MGVEGLVDRIKPSLEQKTLPGREIEGQEGGRAGIHVGRGAGKRRLDLTG